MVDFGAQYAQLIARRVREARVYSEIVPHTMPVAEMVAKGPKAIILSGGPSSVYAEGAPGLDPAIFETGTAVFGMCYGFQLMAQGLGGTVAETGAREYGRTRVHVGHAGTLLGGIPTEHNVWMSHGDSVTAAPDGFEVLASTAGTPVAAFEHVDRGFAGVQWHPEVLHTEHGQKVLEHFLWDIAGCRQTWTIGNIADEQIERIREQIGTDGRAICGLSGGVDSAVAAAIVQKAIGDRLTCVYVDHGLMRKGETEQIERDFVGRDRHQAGTSSTRRSSSSRRWRASRDPETKRKIIGREFIRTFEAAEVDIIKSRPRAPRWRSSSRERSIPTWSSPAGERAPPTSSPTTTSAACPRTSSSSWSSRCAPSSRTRSGWSASSSACRPTSCGGTRSQAPASASGSSARSPASGSTSCARPTRSPAAELTAAGLDRDIWQFPVVLLAEVRSVGVQGDGRTYGHPVVLRPVTSEDAMTADWARVPYDVLERISTRITNEVREINRVTVDITSKPPGTIEWE